MNRLTHGLDIRVHVDCLSIHWHREGISSRFHYSMVTGDNHVTCRNRMLRNCPTDDRIIGGKKKGE